MERVRRRVKKCLGFGVWGLEFRVSGLGGMVDGVGNSV